MEKDKISRLSVLDILGLSSMQEGILFHYLNDPRNNYVEQISIHLGGEIDFDKFKDAWRLVVKTNEMLRTVIKYKKLEKPIQIVLRESEIPIHFIDVSAENDIEETLQKMKEEARKESFDLETGPLMRITLYKLGDTDYEMIIDNHHIIYDGWSNGIILKEFIETYNQLELHLVPVRKDKTKYKEYLKYLQKLDKKQQKEYWTNDLKGFDLKTSIPLLEKREESSVEQSEYIEVLSRETYSSMEMLSHTYNLTLSSIFYTIWGLLLHKYNNVGDILFGYTVSGRPEDISGIENMVGLFINTLPLRVNCEGTASLLATAQAVQETVQNRRAFQNTPLVEIKSYSELSNESTLFDTIVVFENYPLGQIDENSKLKIEGYNALERTNYDLTLIIETFQAIQCKFVYNPEIYNLKSVERIAYHFKQIVQAMIADPTMPIAQIELLSDEEKQKLMYDFNDTRFAYSANKRLHTLLEEQAEINPDHSAVISGERQLTYHELNEKSNQLARLLRDKGIQRDEIVGVMVDRSIEMSLALWAVLKAGGAYLPISPAYPEERVKYLLEDSNFRVLLTESKYLDTISLNCEIIALNDQKNYAYDSSNLQPIGNARDLAYIIYTSGSTGKPKGVMIEHKSVFNVLEWMQQEYQLTENDVILQMTAFTFDVSVWELFWWAMVGAKVCFLAPGGEKDPETIIKTIETNSITTMHFVPSMLNAFLDYLETHSGVERLVSLQAVFTSGEALKPQQLQRFNKLLAERYGTRMYDLYGPTETTIYASYYNCPTTTELCKIIPIGKPVGNTQIYILDQYDKLVPVGVPGELCIGGDGLARGYLNKPDLTAEKFVSNPLIHGQKIYRTGDLAKWLPDGTIEFLGRLDFQVKIRGLRIELSEIDFHLSNYETVKESIVVAREDQLGDKYICAYYVSDKDIELSELRQYLAKFLPDYMIPAYFVKLAKLPLNPNGKVDRKALPAPDDRSGGARECVAPTNPTEEKLVAIWSEVLGKTVGITDNFFEIGGHSLKATVVVGKIYKEFNVEFTIGQIFKRPTIRGLAELVQSLEASSYYAIEPVEEREFYQLSSAQKRVFLLNQIEGDNTSYNIPGVLMIEGELDANRMKTALEELIKRHEVLRTSFAMVDGEPGQYVHENVDFKLEQLVVSDEKATVFSDLEEQIAQRVKEFIRPFDLSQAPLLRVGLLKAFDRHLMTFDMHHIISDGISLEILFNEIIRLYQGDNLEPLRIQYKDFAGWQNQLLQSPKMQEQEAYWLETFAGEIPVLNMPIDYPRPAVMAYDGAQVRFAIEEELTERLYQLAQDQGATLYMVLLAAYNILLAKYTGQEDIIVGSPVAGRLHPDLEKLIGMFVNTLALRNYPSGQKSFTTFLDDVKEKALKAFENQEYQFEVLVDKLDLKRDLSRNSLFDVMFVLQNQTTQHELVTESIQLAPYEIAHHVSKFDLTLYAYEHRKTIEFDFTYLTYLYTQERIEKLALHYQEILRTIVENPEIQLAEISMLLEAEKRQLLVDFNDTSVEFPDTKTLQELFGEQVRKNSDKVALDFGNEQITYQELNEYANRIAGILRSKGVQGDEVVGILVERSFEMVAGMLAVLKSGGAYLPMDTEYPLERIRYMVSDSGAKIVLSTAKYQELSAELSSDAEFIFLDQLTSEDDVALVVDQKASMNNLAYIIYTSGSTGQPKGVGIEQHSLVNYVNWFKKRAEVSENDTTVLLTSFAFDLGYTVLWTSLTSGAELHIVPDRLYKDANQLVAYLEDHSITYIKATPSLFNMLVHSPRFDQGMGLHKLRMIVLGGEQIRPNDLDIYRAKYPEVTFMNHYGPTEATIGCVSMLIHEDNVATFSKRPVIGRPNSNMAIYIVDSNNQPVPIGVPGELCIAGKGIARGYVNKPELTKEKFIQNPFVDASDTARGRLYKTGDLGRWLDDGTIEFIGRIDHQIKIRGYRVEIGEIENQLLTHDQITKVAVIVAEDHGDKYLVAYFVAGEELIVTVLRQYLAEKLPDYMIPSYFVQLDQLPVTANGKLDRKALPDPLDRVNTGKVYVAPTNELEEKLVELWQRVLRVEQISIEDNFFELGGHSLKATDFISKAYKELGVEIPLRQIFQTPVVRDLARYVQQLDSEQYSAIPVLVNDPASTEWVYPVSSAQRRLYVLEELEDLSTGYNVPAVMWVVGDLDILRLERAFRELIRRHETLRTSFAVIDGELSQIIHSEVSFAIDQIAIEPDACLEEEIQAWIRPFDLSEVPLLRVGLFTEIPEALSSTGDSTQILIVDLHHIISDRISRNNLIQEIASLYAGKELPALKVQYKDYSVWQNQLIHSDRLLKQERYWLETFAEKIPVLNLPTDYPRSTMQSYEGDQLYCYLDEELTLALQRLAQEQGVTLYMLLLAVYTILLAKYSGQEDIVVGSPIAGRSHVDLERVIGMFVNTLAMRNYPVGEQSFTAFLHDVKERTLSAYENQDYQFEWFVEKLNEHKILSGNLGTNPLFDVMFALQNADQQAIQVGECQFVPYELASKVAKFDLTFNVTEMDGRIQYILEYRSQLFARKTIQRLAGHFENILAQIVKTPEMQLANIRLLSDEEQKQILVDFNQTTVAYPEEKAIQQLFVEQVERTPDKVALVYEEQELTYRELDYKSNQLASLLREKGVGPDTIVGLISERAPEMVIGVLGIVKAGGAYLPVNVDYPTERVQYMLEDSQVALLLLGKDAQQDIVFSGETIDLLTMDLQGVHQCPDNLNQARDLIYIIYTSGSTGKPKGVMIEHRNVNRLISNSNMLTIQLSDRILQTGSLAFDASTFEIWGSLLNGATLYLIDREDLLSAERFEHKLKEYQITMIWLTAPLFNQFFDENPEIFSELKTLIVGGDALSPKHVNGVRECYKNLAVVNGYGPTESTTFTTFYRIEQRFAENIPIGKPVSNTQVYVFDPYQNLQPIGVPGELWIGGDGLARGYLNRPELTAEKFVSGPTGERLYRTGDLVRWLPDGDIEFLGRIDNQVKIRGFRIELDEITAHLLNHQAIRDAVVVAIEDEGSKYLCAYLVFENEVSIAELRVYLANTLPDYMIPSYFVTMDKLPLTFNGKIDRRALPKPEENIEHGVTYVAPTNEIEEKLAELWSEILKIEQVGIHDHFFEIGGHSLKAATLVGKISKEFNTEIPLAQIFKTPTIAEIAEFITNAEKREHLAIRPVIEREYYPLSSAQKRLYILNQFDGVGIGYNIPVAIILEEELSYPRLQEAVQQLIARHESLRTSFVVIDGTPVQRILPEVPFVIEKLAFTGDHLEETEIISQLHHFIRPFDLAEAPLFRIGVGTVGDQQLLILDIHHIIADGVSMDIVVNDLMYLYKGNDLSDLPIQYKDFSVWQNDWLSSPEMKRQEEFWFNCLAGDLPVLNLPTDFVRPAVMSYAGEQVAFVIESELTSRLRKLATDTGATLYMVLLATYNILLAKYSGQDDTIVGSPVAGRTHVDLQQVVGMFVNTLVMRNQLVPEQSFSTFIEDVKEKALKAYENQDYQFEMLVERMNLDVDLSRNSFFDTMFVLQNEFDADLSSRGMNFTPVDLQTKISKFDLTVNASEVDDCIRCLLTYRTDLFTETTIQRMAGHFLHILHQIIESSAIPLKDLEMITQSEKSQLLYDFNATEVAFPDDTTIHQFFEQQVQKTPDKVAVVFGDQQLTYAELNHRSNQLASRLRECGVKVDDVVGILVERSLEMVIGMLGVLKAGGAYLPIDTEYPRDRIEYMLQDSQAKIVLTMSEFDREIHFTGERIRLDDSGSYVGEGTDLLSLSTFDDLAYVIYTSGSTGLPKGVLLRHRGILNFVLYFNQSLGIVETDRVLQFASSSFDASVSEFYMALLTGATLCMLDQDTINSYHSFTNMMNENCISVVTLPPTYLKNLEPEQLPSIRLLITAGSKTDFKLVEQWKDYVTYINAYGPTEGTICATTFTCQGDLEQYLTVPIGKPIYNTKVYILDQYDQLAPIGVPGELCISGVGLARGYLNREDLTEEKFVSNPFGEKLSDYQKLYRTGDLARWLPDGRVEFLGRIDHQVKIRGYRVEVGEIESWLEKDVRIRESLVLDYQDATGDSYLCAYYVATESIAVMELRQFLSDKLPNYMIPTYFIHLPEFPLTASGKINREALPKPEQEGLDTYAPSTNLIEEKLVTIWQTLLGRERIGIYDNFADLGGQSLKAMRLSQEILKEFNVEITLRQIFKTPTIKELASIIQSADQNQYREIQPILRHENGYYQVSSAQKRLFVVNQLMGENTTYNMPTALVIDGKLDIEQLETAFLQLIERHEALRTSFTVVDEEPVQVVHLLVEFAITKLGETDCAEAEQDAVIQKVVTEFIQPFDLSHAPLLRVGLQKIVDKYLLILDLHHLIADGVSMEVLVHDLKALYAGETLPALRIQYKDFAEWQNEFFQSEKIKTQEAYWLNIFADQNAIPVLDLPTDFQRPAKRGYTGDRVRFVADAEITRRLNQLVSETGATLNMVLLAAYNVLLARYSGQDDIVVGTPLVGRSHADLRQVVGMFVNTLAMRNYPANDKTFATFLREVRFRALEAYENQDYPLEMLIERLNLKRDLSRNPLFDVMFTLQNENPSSSGSDELEFMPVEFENPTAKFDLTLAGAESKGLINFSLEYSTDLFTRETVERFGTHYLRLLEEIGKDAGVTLSAIRLYDEAEKEYLVTELNQTRTDYPREKTVNELFEEQVEKNPERIALVYEDEMMTYRELNQKSNQLARKLRLMGVGSDCKVGLIVERSMGCKVIIGILGILKAGGTYLPIDPEYPIERINYLLEDSGTQIILSQAHLAEKIRCQVEMIDLEQFAFVGDDSNLERMNRFDDLIYVIYTSGTTGKPKGNLTMHYNVTRVVLDTNYIEITEEDKILQLSNYAFDGSVFDIYAALLNGAELILMQKTTALNLDQLADLIREKNVTVFFITTALFNILVETKLEYLAKVRKILFGGERVSVDHARKALKSLGKDRIIHVYGPTETTVFATYYPINEISDRVKTIPIGAPIANTEVYVVDHANRLQPIGVPGELCIAGAGVARGYLNNQELTDAKFIENPFAQKGKLYKTGDLVRMLADGNIEFIGRIDQQVKLRGFRIELGEIEECLMQHPAIRDVVVHVKELAGNKNLVAYIVENHSVSTGELKSHLAGTLPDYMIPSYFMSLDSIPLTSNGKVNRRALPDPDLSTIVESEYVAPENKFQARLVEIWAEILGVERVGIHDNFFELGGHSIKAMSLATRVRKEFEVELPLRVIFETQTVAELATYLTSRANRKSFIEIQRVEKCEYYPVSSAQKRLFTLYRIDENGTSYNMPIAMIMEGDLKVERLEIVLREIIQRHESLRTSFHMINGELVQQIHEDVVFELSHLRVREDEVEEVVQNLIQPFDLAKAPLVRATLLTYEGYQDKYLFVIDMHHIIVDGVSLDCFIQEFNLLYQGETLPELAIQYKDFAVWQNAFFTSGEFMQQEEFWLGMFEEELEPLELPLDYPRSQRVDFAGDYVYFSVEQELTEQIKALAESKNVTLFMILLAAFDVLLAKYSGQSDLVVGTPVAGRNHADLEQLMGMFVNTLVFRSNPTPEETFEQFLAEVRELAMNVFDHQDYQFEMLVEKAKIEREEGRNPLFDVMFILQNANEAQILAGELAITRYEFETKTVKFDLNLVVTESVDGLCLSLGYRTQLFKRETVERMAQHFVNLLINIVEQRMQTSLSDLQMLSKEDQQMILIDFNETAQEIPSNLTIAQYFEVQVMNHSQHPAVVYRDQVFSYQELDRRANQLAKVLMSQGVGQNTIVAIMAERSIELVVGYLAVLKAGGAYLPIDSGYPEERVRYMLEDSNAQMLLTQSHLQNKVAFTGTVQLLNDDAILAQTPEKVKIDAKPSDLAYMIYTSGSTGQPKGVLLEHTGIVNLAHYFKNDLGVMGTDRILQFASCSFDASVWETYMALLTGATLYMVDQDVINSYDQFTTYMNENGITVITLPPTYVMNLEPERLSTLRMLITAGSKTNFELVQRWNQRVEYINAYGPTESTICATAFKCVGDLQGYTSIPIGTPIANTQIYILDREGNPVVVGVPGELCIAGIGLARGYHNRQELTDEKFISNPVKNVEGLADRIYRSGDLAKWLPDGNIEFLGRIDHQVKIRGYRIEPGEIEKQLLQYPGMGDVVVIAREDQSGNTYLCAYIVAEKELATVVLREYLANRLPVYMIPTFFIQLSELPLTPSGKVDRKALPEPDGRIDTGTEYVAPETELEKRLAKIWSQVLGLEMVGIYDKFFEIGGDSLKIISLADSIKREFGVEMKVTDLFKSNTISKLAEVLDEDEGEEDADADQPLIISFD